MNDPNPWLSLSLGAIGTCLGVFNAWRGWARDRVALAVDTLLYAADSGETGIQVTVRNVGHIEAVVDGLGLQMHSGGILRQPQSFGNGLTLPVVVGVKKSISFLFLPKVRESPEMAQVRRVVVETQCGRKFVGTSKSLRSAARHARNKHGRKQ